MNKNTYKKDMTDLIDDEYINRYICSIEKNIVDVIKKASDENNLVEDYQEFLLANSFGGKQESNNVFKYLFYKLKEYSLSYVLVDLIYIYDILSKSFLDIETTIYQTIIYSNNGTWYPNEDLKQNFENNNLSISSAKTTIEKYKNLSSWFDNKKNIKSLRNESTKKSNDIFIRIYNNLNCKLDHSFFKNLFPIDTNFNFENTLLPKSHAHFIALTCYKFYSDNFNSNNFLNTCNTCLTKISDSLNGKNSRIRNIENIIQYYQNDLSDYYNLLKRFTDKKNIFENTVIYFYLSKMFKPNFISSLSSPIVKTLIKRVDLVNLSNFLKEWNEKNKSRSPYEINFSNQFENSDSIRLEYVNDSFYLSVLELLSTFDINLNDTNIQDFLVLKPITETYTDRNGGTNYIKTIENNKLIKKQKLKIEEIYNFLFDVLYDYKSLYSVAIKEDAAGLYNHILTENELKPEDVNTKNCEVIKNQLLNYIKIISNKIEDISINKYHFLEINKGDKLYNTILDYPAITAYLMLLALNDL